MTHFLWDILTHYSLVMPYDDSRYWSTLGQVMACCLVAPSHNLNQCWLENLCIHPRPVSLEFMRYTCRNLHLKIIFPKIFLFLPGANDLSPNRWGLMMYAMHDWTKSYASWIQVLASCLFSTKPIPEPLIIISQSDHLTIMILIWNAPENSICKMASICSIQFSLCWWNNKLSW